MGRNNRSTEGVTRHSQKTSPDVLKDQQKAVSDKKVFRSWQLIIMLIALVIGIWARFYVSKYGHNFDLNSFNIVAKITDHGGNVYAQTSRFNYGPVWFNMLHLFSTIANHFSEPTKFFRNEIIGTLTLADIGISWLLLRRFGVAAAIFFFINPISIAITGYHNQFDNIAIFFGLLGALTLESAIKESKTTRRLITGALLLALSLMTKHLFFLLPLWFALRAKGLRNKLILLIGPPLIFFLSFAPYWGAGHHGIIANVFHYGSFNNAPFYVFVVPGFLQHWITSKELFYGGLVIGAYLFRNETALKAALWYLIFLVLLSPAIANQYLVIVMPAIAAFMSIWFIPYIVLAWALLWSLSTNGIHQFIKFVPQHIIRWDSAPYLSYREFDWAIAMLFVGAFLYGFQGRIIRGARNTYTEIKRLVLNL